MPTPNNIYKSSSRKLILVFEETRNYYADAIVLQSELKLTGKYHMVKVTQFKFGARPSKHNNFKQSYSYAIRAYVKPE